MNKRHSLAALGVTVCLLLSMLHASATRPVSGPTTVFVVRHAEKANDTDETPLSPIGAQRAKALSHALKSVKLDAVFATDTVRARQTATPTAQAAGLAVTKYDGEDALVALIGGMIGKNVLVVGHSNTVPKIVQKLSASASPATFEIGNEFDNFFVVIVDARLTSNLVHRLRYGALEGP